MTGLSEKVPDVAVILVAPEDNRNIGAVARAMSNLGFQDLRLVGASSFSKEKARPSACWGAPLLDSASHFATIAEAAHDVASMIGFSSQEGRRRIAFKPFDAWLQSPWPAGKIGLLFGPEDTGLRNEHLQSCDWLVTLPVRAENPSFNLAQAVLLVLYELSRSRIASSRAEPSAGGIELRQLDKRIEELARESGFLDEHSPPHLLALLQSLFRRAEPSEREAAILLGFLSRSVKTLRGDIPKPACTTKLAQKSEKN